MMTDIVPLGEIATVTAGQSPPGHTYNEHGSGLPFFQGKADFGELYPIARKWCLAPKKIAEAGDILVSVRAPVGPTNIAIEQCCIGRGLAAIRANETLVLRDFLHWNIKYRQPELISKGQGSTFAAIGQKDLKSLQISLPPLAEQRRIVGILNRAAKIQRLRVQAQERLREFIPALFVRMFGDPATNPMGWGKQQLRYLASVGSGTGFPRKEQGVKGEKFPFLKVSDMNLPGNESVIWSWNNTISDGTQQKLRAKVFPAGSIIFPKIGAAISTNKKRLLSCPSCVDNNVMVITSRSNLYNDYLYGLMLHKNLNDFASESNPPSMRKTTVEDWLIPVPLLSLQQQYAGIIGSASSPTDLTKFGQRTMVALSASLMYYLLEDLS